MIERGTITRVVGRQVYVEVPKLGLGVQFGPCDVAWQSETTLVSEPGAVAHNHAGDSGGSTSSSDPAHSHQLPMLAVGMRVLVSAVHGIPDDVVVLGVIG